MKRTLATGRYRCNIVTAYVSRTVVALSALLQCQQGCVCGSAYRCFLVSILREMRIILDNYGRRELLLANRYQCQLLPQNSWLRRAGSLGAVRGQKSTTWTACIMDFWKALDIFFTMASRFYRRKSSVHLSSQVLALPSCCIRAWLGVHMDLL